ncbi:hypothetical protein [Iningainema tapete]|nr:hypothetical protein [Iningainema tapete]
MSSFYTTVPKPTAVPEPVSALGLLVFGILGVTSVVQRKLRLNI